MSKDFHSAATSSKDEALAKDKKLAEQAMKTTFGKNLWNIRKMKKMTQANVADKAGLSTTAISNYEKGAECPSVASAKAIAEALNVPLDDLTGDNDHTRYVKDLERDPTAALLTVIHLFKFHIKVMDDGSVNLTMPHDCAGYSSSEILAFFREYELVQTFTESIQNDSGVEMRGKLLEHLREKYNHLPDFPIYQPTKKSAAEP